ncbi:MAG TPA: zinc-ribbon domain-containing protein [Methyloceanibacter sp.]|nr:zinc-ribbon domain-containing protein [Methyloceanibacter sp.]
MATLIICPTCGTRYEIAAVIPPEGRKVRCSKCSHIWQALPMPPMPVTPVAAPPRREEPPPPMPPEPPEAPDFASYAPEPQPEPSFSSSFEEVPAAPPQEEPGLYPPASNGRDTVSYEGYAQDAEFDESGDLAPDQPREGVGGVPPETAAQPEADMFGEWDSAAPAEAPAMPEAAPAPAPSAKSGRGARMGWLLLLLLVLGLLGFVLLAPKTVVAMLPGATRLYAALGMPINTKGLDFQGVTYGWSQDGEETVLEIKGDIINLTDAAVKLPVVVIVLLDETGKELSQYTTVAREEPLGAGEAAPFLAEIASPPAEVRKLKVRFARAQ